MTKLLAVSALLLVLFSFQCGSVQADPLRLHDHDLLKLSDAPKTFSFTDAPIEDLLWISHLWLKQDYEIIGPVCDRFTISTPSNVSVDEVRAAFAAALSSHQILSWPSKDHFVLQSLGPGCKGDRNLMVETHLIRFSLMPAELAYVWLKPYISATGQIHIADHANALAFSESPERSSLVLFVIQLIDPLAAKQLGAK